MSNSTFEERSPALYETIRITLLGQVVKSEPNVRNLKQIWRKGKNRRCFDDIRWVDKICYMYFDTNWFCLVNYTECVAIIHIIGTQYYMQLQITRENIELNTTPHYIQNIQHDATLYSSSYQNVTRPVTFPCSFCTSTNSLSTRDGLWCNLPVDTFTPPDDTLLVGQYLLISTSALTVKTRRNSSIEIDHNYCTHVVLKYAWLYFK